MLRSVALKTLFDGRRALVAWAVSLALLVAMYVAIWPSMRGQPSMSDFLDQMPEAMRSLFATTGADLSTPVGYLQVELFSFLGPLVLMLYTVTAGAAAVAGEEDRRTMDLLLSVPVSRTRVVVEKLVAMGVGVLLLAAAGVLALMGEGSLADMGLRWGNVTAAMLHMALLALVFGALALAIGAATGHGTLSRAVPAVVAVLAYVVNGLAPVVSWLEPLHKFSPFYQYIGHDPLRNGVSWPSVGVAIATVLVLCVVAVLGFRRRDVLT